MNDVIGLCLRTAGWPSILADLGYGVQVIELEIRTTTGTLVRPDLILVSNKHLHCLVVECKSGSNVDPNQKGHYSDLTTSDLLRWITPYTKAGVTHDVCYVGLKENAQLLSESLPEYPILIFGDDSISKDHTFPKTFLEKAFQNPIDLSGMAPPLNYYPFSELDEDVIIVPRVLRMLVSLSLQTARGGESAVNETIYTLDEIVQKTHPFWKALSKDQRRKLKERVRNLVHTLLESRPELGEVLAEVEEKHGYRITANLKELQNISNKIVTEMNEQSRMESF